MKAWAKGLAIAAVALAGSVTFYELSWLHRSGVAKVLVALGLAVVLLGVSVILGHSAK
jgi:predicted phage tail protein